MVRLGASDWLVETKRAVLGGVVMIDGGGIFVLIIGNKSFRIDCVSPEFGRKRQIAMLEAEGVTLKL